MRYKILEVHIAYNADGTVTITVAIQSNPLEEQLTRWKAYSSAIPSDAIFNFQRVAAQGTKLSAERAAQIFADLNKAHRYEN